jgi:hypothetical protein
MTARSHEGASDEFDLVAEALCLREQGMRDHRAAKLMSAKFGTTSPAIGFGQFGRAGRP